MTTKNVSLMAMTSSEGYTWMGLICIGKQSSLQPETIYQETAAFLQNAAYTIRIWQFSEQCWPNAESH